MIDMNEVRTYLSNHMNEPVKVEALAHHLHFSTAQVYRDFVRQAGCSPRQYIVDFKMERALHMIGATVLSFEEISLSLGFRYESHFFRVFKDIMGVTPQEYRRHTAGRKSKYG
jgi:iron complex transport system substrate-binding protein